MSWKKTVLLGTVLFLVNLNRCQADGLRASSDKAKLIDPKTVEEKPMGKSLDAYSQLKFLFFGTSRTVGTMLNDPLSDAFPYLLSPNATNLAIAAGISKYPSHCAASMLKNHAEESFDVIVLEFPPHFWVYTFKLAERLRERFPNALIIFFDMWRPIEYTHVPSGNPIQKWAKEKGHNLMRPDFPQHFIDSTIAEEWDYPEIATVTQDQLDDAKQLTGPVEWVIVPRPTNAHVAMKLNAHHFVYDLNHYSKAGHQFVKSLISEKLHEINFRTTHDPTVRPWKHLDQCSSWFRTGATSMKHNMVMSKFSDKGKFALEPSSSQSGRENWIAIDAQDSAQPLELHVEFMTTAPDCLYQNVRLHLYGQSKLVECKSRPASFEIHVTETIHVGTVLPGVPSLLRIEPLVADDGSDDNKWPFRIVSILLLPTDAVL